jgi:hypothetical protein
MTPNGFHQAWWWVVVLLACAAIAMLALRGYYSPAILIDFANMKLCALEVVRAQGPGAGFVG